MLQLGSFAKVAWLHEAAKPERRAATAVRPTGDAPLTAAAVDPHVRGVAHAIGHARGQGERIPGGIDR